MQYRRFGKTNLSLSVFSLGTMRYLASEENAIWTVQAAIAKGINHIETARGYGSSELYLEAALRAGVPREQIYITTKISPTADADAMDRSIDESLDRLGISYVDALGIHGVNTSEHLSWIEDSQGCMRAVQRAIDDGRARHVGFSTHAPLEIILRTIETQQFEFVNLHYYLFNQRNRAAVDLAHQQDMGVFIISPADKGGMLHAPPDTLIKLCQPFTPLALNYRFLLSDPRITTLSLGAAAPEELKIPLQVADHTEPLTPEEQKTLERLQLHQEVALAADCSSGELRTNQCSQCFACLPCPENINIPEVLRLRNLAVAYNMTAFGQYRYGMFENAGHWFPGMKANRCTDCGDCLPRCPENLDIPALLRDTHDRLSGTPRRRLWS